MIPFTLSHPDTSAQAVASYARSPKDSAYLAGGTTLIDLAKLHVEQPAHVIDVSRLGNTGIRRENGTVSLGAAVAMSEAADHETIRTGFPIVAETLRLAASAQIRNMATLGGNILQRVRCSYFRDNVSPCNKRAPGTGCSAVEGEHRGHAILGGSDACFAFHPSDFCVALAALDATVHTRLPDGGNREIPFRDFHRLPGDTPHLENALRPGELIESIHFPDLAYGKASTYVKVRDRSSYQFALASAGVLLDLDGDRVREVRIALGGVGTVPWRATEAEAELKDRSLSSDNLRRAAEAAIGEANPRRDNAYKVALTKEVVIKAISVAATRA